jgi:hypothetical protein
VDTVFTASTVYGVDTLYIVDTLLVEDTVEAVDTLLVVTRTAPIIGAAVAAVFCMLVLLDLIVGRF